MMRISLEMWSSWTPDERAQMQQYWEATGQKWYIDFHGNERTLEARAVQKDHDEYIEDMSLGGKTYRPSEYLD